MTATVARGALRLDATACRAGDDVVVTLTGGDRPHVGCVVIAQPHPSTADSHRTSATSSVVALPPHRDEVLARHVAELLATNLGCTVVVAAGVHTDRLTKRGIADYLRLGEKLAADLLRGLSS